MDTTRATFVTQTDYRALEIVSGILRGYIINNVMQALIGRLKGGDVVKKRSNEREGSLL
jgi:hypothetical protein